MSRVKISRFFTWCSLLQNICMTSANILVLVLRFLCSLLESFVHFNKTQY
jgi:hypothetical protein